MQEIIENWIIENKYNFVVENYGDCNDVVICIRNKFGEYNTYDCIRIFLGDDHVLLAPSHIKLYYYSPNFLRDLKYYIDRRITGYVDIKG